MKRNHTYIFFSKTLPFLLFLFLFAACSQEEGNVTDDGTPRKMTLAIGAEGTDRVRAYGGDRDAKEGEFIHSLHVFVVDASTKTVEWTDYFVDDGNDGNLLQKVYSIPLPPGLKYVYAFANMDEHQLVSAINGETSVKTILAGITVETSADILETLEDAEVDNPAAKVDLENKKFIPMCTKQPISFGTNNQVARVEMVRLVSRIDLTLSNTEGISDVVIKGITLTGEDGTGKNGTASRVTMINPVTNIPRELDVKVLPSGSSLTIGAGKASSLSFYINGTEDNTDKPFRFVFTVGSDEKKGTTKAVVIPRNAVMPVTAIFSDYIIILKTTVEVAPIGGFPISMPVETDLINLQINLYEGCTFTITPYYRSMKATDENFDTEKDNPAMYPLMKTWKITGALPAWLKIDNTRLTATSGNKFPSFTGMLSALPGQSVNLTLEVETDGGSTFTRDITIWSRPLGGTLDAGTASISERTGNMQPENLQVIPAR